MRHLLRRKSRFCISIQNRQNLATFWVVNQQYFQYKRTKILWFSQFSCFGVLFDHFFALFYTFFVIFRENAFRPKSAQKLVENRENFTFFSKNLESTKKHDFREKSVKKVRSASGKYCWNAVPQKNTFFSHFSHFFAWKHEKSANFTIFHENAGNSTFSTKWGPKSEKSENFETPINKNDFSGGRHLLGQNFDQNLGRF